MRMLESMYMEFILYNNWANRQVLQACQKLSEDQLAATIPGAYGTIRATLEHIIRGEGILSPIINRHLSKAAIQMGCPANPGGNDRLRGSGWNGAGGYGSAYPPNRSGR